MTLMIVANTPEDMRQELIRYSKYRAGLERHDVASSVRPLLKMSCRAREEVWTELEQMLQTIPILPKPGKGPE